MTDNIITSSWKYRRTWKNDTCALCATRGLREAHSICASWREMPTRPLLYVSMKTPGLPATSVTNTSRTPHVSRITSVWRYIWRLYVRLKDAVPTMVLWKERITSAMSCIYRSFRRKEIWGMSVTCLFFQTTIKYCKCFMTSRLCRTQSAVTILSSTWLIRCASISFVPSAKKTHSWMWCVEGTVLGTTDARSIPSVILFPVI
jgi:hypothetical protein